jgi:amidase
VSVLKCRFQQLVIGLCTASLTFAIQAKPAGHTSAAMDKDLMEVTVPQLQGYYARHKYTVTQVVDWYLERITRYNGIYRAIEQVFDMDARAAAAREDAEA